MYAPSRVLSWSPWTQSDIKTLERVQERAARMISGLQGSTYDEKMAELFTLGKWRVQLDMVQTFKIIHGYDNEDVSTFFNLVGDGVGRLTKATSITLNLVPKIERNDLGKHFFSNRFVNIWIEMPYVLKRAKSVASFKRGVINLLTNDDH